MEQDVDFAGESYMGGKVDQSGSGAENPPTIFGGLLFDVFETMVLNSVEVLAYGAEERTFLVANSQGELVADTTVFVEDGLQRVVLDFLIEPGESYELRCPVDPSLHRNVSGFEFPYELGPLGEITQSNFGDILYFFFYNWEVSRPSKICTSERAEVFINYQGVGVEEISSINALSLSPNPVNDWMRLSLYSEMSQTVYVEILDNLGRTISSQKEVLSTGENIIPFDVTEYPQGLFYMIISNEEGREMIMWIKQE